MFLNINIKSRFLRRKDSCGIRGVGQAVGGFLALVLFASPLFSFAQSNYYFSSDPAPHYPPYNCGDPGTVCGSSQVQSFSTNFQPYNLTQVAGVAAAVPPVSVAEVVEVAPPQVENPPQLPRTGGGGRASEVKLKTISFFIPMTAVFFLLLHIFFRVVSKRARFGGCGRR